MGELLVSGRLLFIGVIKKTIDPKYQQDIPASPVIPAMGI